MAKTYISTDADLSCLDTVNGSVEKFLVDCSCPGKVMMQILVSVEEVFVNVANYAYEPEEEKAARYCKVELESGMEEHAGWVRIVISDGGKPFDPLKRDKPDISLSADEREIGGLGIHMVRTIMDEISYEYKDSQNILTMVKRWNIS